MIEIARRHTGNSYYCYEGPLPARLHGRRAWGPLWPCDANSCRKPSNPQNLPVKSVLRKKWLQQVIYRFPSLQVNHSVLSRRPRYLDATGACSITEELRYCFVISWENIAPKTQDNTRRKEASSNQMCLRRPINFMRKRGISTERLANSMSKQK